MKGLIKAKKLQIIFIVGSLLLSHLAFIPIIVNADNSVLPKYNIQYNDDCTEATIIFDMNTVDDDYEVIELTTKDGGVLYSKENPTSDAQFKVNKEGDYQFNILYSEKQQEVVQEESATITDEEKSGIEGQEESLEQVKEPLEPETLSQQFEIAIEFEEGDGKGTTVPNVEPENIGNSSKVKNAKNSNQPAGWNLVNGTWKYNYTEIFNGSLEVDDELKQPLAINYWARDYYYINVSSVNKTPFVGQKYHQFYVPLEEFGWQTTASDTFIELGNPRIKFGHSVYNTTSAADGNWFAELNATEVSALYQTIETTPGEVIQWKLAHKGRNGVDTMKVHFGPTLNSSEATFAREISSGNQGWSYYDGQYVIPHNQDVTNFVFEAIDAATPSLSEGNLLDAIEFETRLSAPKVVVNDDLKSADVYIYSATDMSNLNYCVNDYSGQKKAKPVELSRYDDNHYKGTIQFTDEDDITVGENKIEAWQTLQREFVATDTFEIKNTATVQTKVIEKETSKEVPAEENVDLVDYLLPGETAIVEHEIKSETAFDLGYRINLQFYLDSLTYDGKALSVLDDTLQVKIEDRSDWTSISFGSENSIPIELLNQQKKFYIRYEVKLDEGLYNDADIKMKLSVSGKNKSAIKTFDRIAKVAACPTLDIQDGLNIQWCKDGGMILGDADLKNSIKVRPYDSQTLIDQENINGSLELTVKSINGLVYGAPNTSVSTEDYGLYLVEYLLKDTRSGLETEDRRLMGIYDVPTQKQVRKSYGVIHKDISISEIDLKKKKNEYTDVNDFIFEESEIRAIKDYTQEIDVKSAEYKLNGFNFDSNQGLYNDIIISIDEEKNFFASPKVDVLESEPQYYFDIPAKIDLSKENGINSEYIGEKAEIRLIGEFSSTDKKFKVETKKSFDIVDQNKIGSKYSVSVYDNNGNQSYMESQLSNDRLLLGDFGFGSTAGLKQSEVFWLNTKDNNNQRGLYKGNMTFYMSSYK